MLRLITVECIVTVDNVFVTKHTTICCHYPTFCHLLTWLIQSMPSNIFRLIDFLQLFRWKIHTKLLLKWHSKVYQSLVFILLSQKSLYHLKYLAASVSRCVCLCIIPRGTKTHRLLLFLSSSLEYSQMWLPYQVFKKLDCRIKYTAFLRWSYRVIFCHYVCFLLNVRLIDLLRCAPNQARGKYLMKCNLFLGFKSHCSTFQTNWLDSWFCVQYK